MLLNTTSPGWLQGIKLIIFDFDGTVADTSPLHAAAFSEVLSPLGVEFQYESIAGMKTADALLLCSKVAGLELNAERLAELVVAKQSKVREMIAESIKPLPGVDAFLRWARPRYRLSMGTSGSRDTVELALKKLGYDNWFDPLVCAEDVTRAKPHPDIYLRVLELTGFAPQHALVFEDSDVGINSAKRAGIVHIDVRKFDWAVEQKSEASGGN